MTDKVYRPIILVLLIALVGLLAIQTVPSLFGPSADCQNARGQAQAVLNLDIPLLTEYQTSAYDTADNIYQQQFSAAEYSFLTLHIIAKQNEAIIGLLTACP